MTPTDRPSMPPASARSAARGMAAATLCFLLACGDDEDPGRPAADVAVPDGPSVLLITVDTLRPDRLGIHGGPEGISPKVDALAREGVVFERAFAPVPLTLPSHATLLSGLTPARHGVRDNALYSLPEAVQTLAETTSEAGWATGAFVAAFVLDARFGLSQGFDHYDDRTAHVDPDRQSTVPERPCEEVTERALFWIEQRERPFFAWVHYYDPHFPYQPTPALAERFPGQPYDAEVARVDAQVGRLIDTLRRRGELDDTLVVFTADHGESMGQHGEPTHGALLYQSTMHVPLLFRHPRLAAGRRGDAAGLVDVTPTVRSFLGLDGPAVEGRELFAAGAEQQPTVLYMESELPRINYGFRPLTAASDGRWKYVGSTPPELYDLDADADELNDVAAQHPEQAERLEAFLDEVGAQETMNAQYAATSSDLSAVQNLGYMGGSSDVEVTREEWTVAELLTVISLRDAARAQLTAGRSQQCYETCQQLVELAPRCAQGWEHGGAALARMQRWEDARTWLEEAIEIHEGVALAHWNLATCLHHLGEPEQALVEVSRTVELDPEHVAALGLLAQEAIQEEEFELARELLTTIRRVAGDRPAGRKAAQQLDALDAQDS